MMTIEQRNKIFTDNLKFIDGFIINTLSKYQTVYFSSEIFEDLKQEIYVNIISALDRFRGDSDIKTYIGGIIKNIIFQSLHKNDKLKNLVEKITTFDSGSTFDNPDYSNNLILLEIYEYIENKYTREACDIFYDYLDMPFVKDKSKIIGDKYNLSEMNLKKHIRSIMTDLKNTFNPDEVVKIDYYFAHFKGQKEIKYRGYRDMLKPDLKIKVEENKQKVKQEIDEIKIEQQRVKEEIENKRIERILNKKLDIERVKVEREKIKLDKLKKELEDITNGKVKGLKNNNSERKYFLKSVCSQALTFIDNNDFTSISGKFREIVNIDNYNLIPNIVNIFVNYVKDSKITNIDELIKEYNPTQSRATLYEYFTVIRIVINNHYDPDNYKEIGLRYLKK